MAVDPARSAPRRSPLQHRAGQLAALPDRVIVQEVPFLVQLNLRAAPGPATDRLGALLGTRLPVQSCRWVAADERQLLWLGPDEWLLVTDPATDEATEQLIDRLRQAIGSEHGSVTDVSGQRTALRLAGPAARELLAIGCAIDLHPAAAPTGSCLQTLLAQTGVIIVVQDSAAGEFRLLVRASLADYLADWLIDAVDGLLG